jgi:hypothetical protein
MVNFFGVTKSEVKEITVEMFKKCSGNALYSNKINTLPELVSIFKAYFFF